VRAALLAIAAIAACGDDARAPEDPPDAGPIACRAIFHGNVEEQVASQGACATIDGGALRFDIPIRALDTSLAVAIELGASPTAGAYTPPIVPAWSATAFQRIGNGGCMYVAGADAVPQGDFELRLDALAPPHGALHVTQSVLVVPGTDCGDLDTETVDVTF
jgi:hypothetical protein